MKLLLTILSVFVLLGLQTNALAAKEGEERGCGKDTRVLAPGKHSVLLFDQPFVVQWQDDDKCLGDMVKIEIIELSTNESNIFGDDYPNTGVFAIDRLAKRIHSYRSGRSRIQISNADDDSKSIKSKSFLVENNSLHETGYDQMHTAKVEGGAIRDLLRRLTVVERQNKKLTKNLKKLSKSDREIVESEQGCPSGKKVNFDKAECDEEYICYGGTGKLDWYYTSRYDEVVGKMTQSALAGWFSYHKFHLFTFSESRCELSSVIIIP